MAIQRSFPSSAADEARLRESGDARIKEDLRLLGEALGARVQDVLARIAAAGDQAALARGQTFDAAVRESFERIGANSTAAVARWMAGGDPQDGRQTGREAWDTYGQLAAQSAAPLNELTKRCLRWRDSVDSVLRESASELGVSAEALGQALAMVQRTLDVTLVRVCESFETERERTDKELAQRQEELAFMATHDALTGLPNRTLILDRGEQMLAQWRRSRTPVAALFIDLDNFKHINDTFGHDMGDQLLRAVTARLERVVRDTDALGRLGGDEFIVMAQEPPRSEGPQVIAERLLEALRDPFELNGNEEIRLTVTASIGIAIGERASAEEFVRDADTAMYRAKLEGKNRCVVFEPGMQDAMQELSEFETDLRRAVENDEFFLVYQPTFDLRDMRPIGMEALLRWNRAGQRVVQPEDFVPLLEQTGLIVDVGRWVLRAACKQAAAWRRAGHPIGVAVNVSARQLDDDGFVDDLKSALRDSELEVGALTLEITESSLARNAEENARRLSAIRDLGVRVAIDDFGTGHISLAHLEEFSVDTMKIDRLFISRLTRRPDALVRTLVQLGRSLSIETLAEGIERKQELSLVQAAQCDTGQGFLFGRPLDAKTAEAFLQSWVKRPEQTPQNGSRANAESGRSAA